MSTLADSGLEVREAERVTLIYDAQGQGRPGRDMTPKKDTFFEAYVREMLREFWLRAYLSSDRQLLIRACVQSTSNLSLSITLSRSTITA